ncbi:MAG: hypothetical protein HY554_05690 [Elusimicrobia bacterium]|nr:hypothetical protein [Elusimicrobiota bacterium]
MAACGLLACSQASPCVAGEKAAPRSPKKQFSAQFLGETNAPYKPTRDQEGFTEDWARHGPHRKGEGPRSEAPKADVPSPAAAGPDAPSAKEPERLRDAPSPAAPAPSPAAVKAPGAAREETRAAPPALAAPREESAAGQGQRLIQKLGAAFQPADRKAPSTARTVPGGARDSRLASPPAAAPKQEGEAPIADAAIERAFDAAAPRPAAEAAPGPAREAPPPSGAPSARGTAREPGPAARGPRELFVSVEMDVSKTPGEYRDAVGELHRGAGFSADPRFPPAFRGADRARVALWGWIPLERVREALGVRGVSRVQTLPRAPQEAPGPQEPEWRLTLRLTQPEPAPAAVNASGTSREELLAAALLRLGRAGFTWMRTEPLQERGLVALRGSIAPRSIERVLADPAVVKLARAAAPPRPAAPPRQASAGPTGQAAAVLSRHPVLLLLALLLPLAGRLLRSYR